MSVCHECGQDVDAQDRLSDHADQVSELEATVKKLREIIAELTSAVRDAADSAEHQSDRV